MTSGIPTLREFFAERGLQVKEMRDGDGNILDPDKLRYKGTFIDGPDGKMLEVKNGVVATQTG